MPHAEPDDGLPRTPPRAEQAQIPVTPQRKPGKPFLEEISMADFQPDQRLVDEALGGMPDVPGAGTEAASGGRNPNPG